ncbi:hypothetical protein AK88_01069 [Plasmodium fragile]|uniref:Uncharacterized protein n=1 Tax=Plasmodium fragile TaxID=5857 RepID=A0A0D9QTT0_PLAFR|nr:uncharacterized protein AK88_01069 [Plasmodium fragile]KJP89191.1 hypothetical protein AK88_01069 [Plasmodium fragile]
MKYLLPLLHVIALCIYKKEHEGECYDCLVCGSLAVWSGGERLRREEQKTTHSRILYQLTRRKRRGGARRRRNNRSAKRRNRRRKKRLARQRKAQRRKARREQRKRKKQRKRAERKRKRKERKKRRQERKERKRQKKRQKKEEKERQKEREAGGPSSDDLQTNSNGHEDDGAEVQAGSPPAEDSYNDGASPYNAAEEGASSPVASGVTQMGGHPPERSGGPIDSYGSYGSSLHDDNRDISSHSTHGGAGTAVEGVSPYEAELGKNVKVIHFDRLKKEPKGELINKIRGILNTLE